ncbi:uncharacterized protein LOC113209639 isoform X5 [Frankliniella occidentalis]|uniref:Uncharacterized protein LOC113209639 isoform X5 n=1 Tax=Frankliniella occidentalis TaxID=133901 RepID=A0A6J1SP81_FRAOC|nr:uncharacterized protein LOC113209639 isoform X5 [Frankliniella occidentalis]
MDEELVEPVKEEVHSRNSLCRLCACYTQLLIPIFESEGLENSLSDKIEKYLPIQVGPSDVLPVHICFQCASTVLSWHELSESCVEAQHKLKAMFGANSDPQCSPSGSRDADIYEDTASHSDMFTADNPTTSNDEMFSSDNQSETQKAIQDIGEALSKGGETERCLQEVKLEGISQKLICQFCNIEFSDTSGLGKHNCLHSPLQYPVSSGGTLLMDNLGPSETNQNCQFCGRYFRHSSVLNMHSVSCKKLSEKFDDNDGFCDYVTLDRSLESIEEGKYRGKNKKPFRKNLAKRGSRSSYSTLGRSELKIKALETLDSVKSHLESEEAISGKRGRPKDSKEKRVSCAYCMKSFIRKYDAISHVRKSHRNKLEEFLIWLERRKLFLKDKLCSLCDKTFESSEEATNHIQDCHKEDHSASDDGNQISLQISLPQVLPTFSPVVQHSIAGSGNIDCGDSLSPFFTVNDSQNVGEANSITVSISSQLSFINKNEKQFDPLPVNCETLERADSCNMAAVPEPTNVCFNDSTGVVVLSEKVDGTDFFIDSYINEEKVGGHKITPPGIHPSKVVDAGDLSLPILIDAPAQSLQSPASVSVENCTDFLPSSNCDTGLVVKSQGGVIKQIE